MRTFRESWRSRGPLAFVISGLIIGFYLVLYFTEWLTPWSEAMGLRNKWFLYGLIYSVAMTGGAIYYLRKHGNARYNKYRIVVNVAVQVLLAFTLPLVMPLLAGAPEEEYGKYEFYFSYLWPLDWYKLHPGTLQWILPVFAVYAIVMSLIVAPLLAVFLGKRWYCSWVCGCGGLANTFGDPWRHLTATSTRSWKFEKWAIHLVLALAVGSTGALGLDHLIGGQNETLHTVVAGGDWWSIKSLYGLVVGSILAGVVGTGLYPLFGPRVWCRNFCPMAAILGMSQKLGRFRIRVKKDMCISCGNCTTYCEMGIDVRSYAQSNQSFTRSSCVGCGMCAHVCPRGVLKLEDESKKQSDKSRTKLNVVDF